MQTYTIDIRPRRQTTLPRQLLEEVGIDVGDKLEAKAEGKKIILKPKKQIALEALAELQRMFQESGIPEEEMQANLRKIRLELTQKRYGKNLYRR